MSHRFTDPGREMHGALAWMTRNHVAANLIMVFLIVGGLLSGLRIRQEVFPEFSFDAVNVSVSYPGASPEEVEQGITLAIEEAVSGVENVVEVTSTSGEGFARVVAEYDSGADPQQVYQDIQQEIDRIRSFPEDAEEPEIEIASRRRQVMDILLYGDVSEWALRNLAEEVRERLLQADGVSLVELSGARDYEVHIQPTREALRRYGLTLREIAERVARSAIEVPAGSIDSAAGELLVRFDERRDYAAEFAEIPLVNTAEGAVLKLGDVAEVREGFEESDRLATYDGKRAIGIDVFRIGDETPVSVSQAAHRAIEDIIPSLPVGVGLAIEDDDSAIYQQRLMLLLKNLGIGLVLVLTLLGLFLEPRLAFWVMLGIPASFLGAFLVMPLFDVSLNMISMFAFIIALGIVVDDAIVVGENIHEMRARGLPRLEAAIRGVRQIAMPVTFSILTNCIAFLPLALLPGTIGKIWRVIPVVVISVFLISLIESLFVLPSHLSTVRAQPRNPLIRLLRRGQKAFERVFLAFVHRIFSPFLYVCIRNRYLVVATALALLMLTFGYARSGRLGMTLMPKVESDVAVVTARLPVGSPLAATIAVRDRLETAARHVAERNGDEELLLGIYTRITDNEVQTRAYLTPPEIRPMGTADFANRWRSDLGELSGVDTLRFESDRGGPGGGASISIDLSHSDVPTLERAASALGRILAQFPQVSDIDDGYQPGKEQFNFTLKPAGRSLGLSSQDVARQIRNAFEGAVALRQQRGRNEVQVRVLLPEEQRNSVHDIEQLLIRTPAGGDVPLRQIADVERGRAYTSIKRIDGRRTLNVSANVTPDKETNQVLATLEEEGLPALQRDYPGLSWRYAGRQSDMRESMSALGNFFLIALLGLYSLLAVPFRSYIQPLVVMLAIPFGIVGAVAGHMLMGYSLSVISMMGIIALSGVVINDSLVMIVYANEKRRDGDPPLQAIHDAGVRRFRPILLTTLTTFGGLSPMIFETSRQARFMIPMAISLGYGLLFATAIILLLIPSLYMILEDIAGLLGKLRRLLTPHDEEAAETGSLPAD